MQLCVHKIIRLKLGVFIAGILPLLIGCAADVIKYTPNPPMANVQKTNLRVVIAPFETIVPKSEVPNTALINLVPFYPSVKGTDYRSDDEIEIGKALAEDLAASKLFSLVEYRTWEELGASYVNYDLLISGRFYYDRRQISQTRYGLSLPLVFTAGFLPGLSLAIAESQRFEDARKQGKQYEQDLSGTLIWATVTAIGTVAWGLWLGPIETAERDILFELEMKKPSSPNYSIWKKTFQVSDDKSGTYINANSPRPESAYNSRFSASTPALFQKAFRILRQSLLETLKEGGPAFQVLNKKD